MFYTIPASLAAEIDELESLVHQFQSGRLDPTAFKARRVPFGVYEQRQDNTFMVRVRCPGGAITPRQLKEVAELSQVYGAETLHITTRQELQLHDVALQNVVPILRRLLSVGLATRGGGGNTVRNLTAAFDAGVAKDEIFDVSPYVFALTSRLIDEPDSWLLPRKYKIAFANSEKDSIHAVFNDLGFIAIQQKGVSGFAVYVAGGMGTKPQVGHLLHEFIAEAEVYLVAEAVKRVFNQHGNRKNRHAARLRFLWNSLGEAKFRELYQQELDELRRQASAPLTLPPQRKLPAPVTIAAVREPSSDFQLWRSRFASAQKQPGLYLVLVPIFLGNLANEHALALADFLLPFGDDVLRATIDQNLCLRNIPEAYLGNVHALVKSITCLASEPRWFGSSVACTGAATCKLGICLPRGALAAITKKLQAASLDWDRLADFKMNLSGCPNTCGAHLTADLGFFGKVARNGQTPYPAYGIVAGAKLGHGKARLAELVGEVSARDLPAFVVEFLKSYLEQSSHFASFTDYFEQQGRQDLRALCEKHRIIPGFDDDKNYYYDWGATEIFSLAGRGVGECSAGLFDLIEVDLKNVRTLRTELGTVSPGSKRDEILDELALSAARMLLITRGVEAHSEAEVFTQFRRHFIESGLVAAQYLPLVEAAQRKDTAHLRAQSADVLSLAQTVEELYGKMDNSMRFPGESAQPPGPAEPKPPRPPAPFAERDLRGVLCPMNFVKTKLALEGLSVGQRLRLLLDDGAPIQNVPRSVAEEGHTIVEQIKTGGHWTVVIEKR